eukprot:365509-Chlamydomonas_euryale.AAC.19
MRKNVPAHLWAMVTVVRPPASLSRAACTARSDWVSRADVASSRSRICDSSMHGCMHKYVQGTLETLQRAEGMHRAALSEQRTPGMGPYHMHTKPEERDTGEQPQPEERDTGEQQRPSQAVQHKNGSDMPRHPVSQCQPRPRCRPPLMPRRAAPHLWVLQDGTRDCDALLLPAAQLRAALAHVRLVSALRPRDEVVRVGGARRGLNLLARGPRLDHCNVVVDASCKQSWLLRHQPHLHAKGGNRRHTCAAHGGPTRGTDAARWRLMALQRARGPSVWYVSHAGGHGKAVAGYAMGMFMGAMLACTH